MIDFSTVLILHVNIFKDEFEALREKHSLLIQEIEKMKQEKVSSSVLMEKLPSNKVLRIPLNFYSYLKFQLHFCISQKKLERI